LTAAIPASRDARSPPPPPPPDGGRSDDELSALVDELVPVAVAALDDEVRCDDARDGVVVVVEDAADAVDDLRFRDALSRWW